MTPHFRAFDVVVYGATGFTGQLVAEYLARSGPGNLRWALAGRNREKLEAVLNALPTDGAAPAPALIQADASDAESLAKMAAQTRVVLTTVGPYMKYGEPLVRACVEQATDYVDLTGEAPFVDMTIEKYHQAARDKGVRIISCCGFDSIPHDLGALYTIQKLAPTAAATVEGFVSARGTFSGGTLHSALGIMGGAADTLAKYRTLAREGWHDGPRHIRYLAPKVHFEERVKGWGAPMPTIDPEVVLRSARLLSEYGPDFRYGHYARTKSLATVMAMGVGLGALVGLAKFSATRALLGKIKAPGDGPSAEERAKGWFKVHFIGESEGRLVQTQVTGGDPGYTDTAKMISEAALCLAFDRDNLAPHTGVVTPAAGIGQPLFPRLERAGIHFSEVS
jgi:short subunit dehydrogenase-like uncharacterized protein